MNEHRVIEQVLSALEEAAERDVPISFYERVADFVANFADGCHHDKEETLLFTSLEKHGMPRGAGPVGVMLHEHEVGRSCMQRLGVAISASDCAAARKAAGDYSALLRQHIQKEDNVLYPMARKILPAEEIELLAARFGEVEASRDDTARYQALAAQLLAEATSD